MKRKIDDKGRLNIPPVYLDEIGVAIGQEVDIKLDQKNKILIIKKENN